MMKKVKLAKPVFGKRQSMVEFALTVPIFLLIIMGIMDFSYRFHLQLSLDDIALSAAQYGATRNEALGYPPGMSYDSNNPYDFTPTESMILDKIKNDYKRPGLDTTKMVITIEKNQTVSVMGNDVKAVQVSITYPLEPITPFFSHMSSNWGLKSEESISKKP